MTKRVLNDIEQITYFVKELERQVKECNRVNEVNIEMIRYYLDALERHTKIEQN